MYKVYYAKLQDVFYPKCLNKHGRCLDGFVIQVIYADLIAWLDNMVFILVNPQKVKKAEYIEQEMLFSLCLLWFPTQYMWDPSYKTSWLRQHTIDTLNHRNNICSWPGLPTKSRDNHFQSFSKSSRESWHKCNSAIVLHISLL